MASFTRLAVGCIVTACSSEPSGWGWSEPPPPGLHQAPVLLLTELRSERVGAVACRLAGEESLPGNVWATLTIASRNSARSCICFQLANWSTGPLVGLLQKVRADRSSPKSLALTLRFVIASTRGPPRSVLSMPFVTVCGRMDFGGSPRLSAGGARLPSLAARGGSVLPRL